MWRRLAFQDAHGPCDRIEGALWRSLGNAVIIVHVEPGAKAKHSGVVVL